MKKNGISECISLKSFKIPVNITEIGKTAFENCRSLGKVELAPNSQLKTIYKIASQDSENIQLSNKVIYLLSFSNQLLVLFYKAYFA